MIRYEENDRVYLKGSENEILAEFGAIYCYLCEIFNKEKVDFAIEKGKEIKEKERKIQISSLYGEFKNNNKIPKEIKQIFRDSPKEIQELLKEIFSI